MCRFKAFALVLLFPLLCLADIVTYPDETPVSDTEHAAELISKFHLSKDDANRAVANVKQAEGMLRGQGLGFVSKLGDKVLDEMVKRGLDRLEKAGDTEYAYYKRSDWKANYSGMINREMNSHHIGDHPTYFLSQWLQDFCMRLLLILGKDAFEASHLSDLMTINDCTKVTIRPCSFPIDGLPTQRIDEYRRHFAMDDDGILDLYGEIPVITYWAVQIGLIAAGAPIPFVAGAVEYGVAHWVAPKISDAIFYRSNCQEE